MYKDIVHQPLCLGHMFPWAEICKLKLEVDNAI
jgi:hypothetical protein